jgi:triphosphoribosyl-dephospho-CoA synthase
MLERIIAEGGDHIAFLLRLNDDYKRLRLTLGGVADRLGIAFGWLVSGEEIAPDAPGAECFSREFSLAAG